MKRWILFFLITVGIGLFTRVEPTGTDVASLQPVKLIYVDIQEGSYILVTDTGRQGRGNTVAKAVSNLKDTSAGKVFLNTAEHLLVSPAALASAERFMPYLRPDCSMTIAEVFLDAETVCKFLDTHKPGFTLNDLRAGASDIPVLKAQEGGMVLEKP